MNIPTQANQIAKLTHQTNKLEKAVHEIHNTLQLQQNDTQNALNQTADIRQHLQHHTTLHTPQQLANQHKQATHAQSCTGNCQDHMETTITEPKEWPTPQNPKNTTTKEPKKRSTP